MERFVSIMLVAMFVLGVMLLGTGVVAAMVAVAKWVVL